MATIFQAIGTVYAFFIGLFGDIIGVITDNAVLLVPVLVSLFGTAVFFAVKVIKRLGLRGRR